ncbi:MAG TPA: hypothetical protein VNO52_07485, partial [Methylomirabilota bacterium]|nr:hypothetical protein [Methylomirabilota bacterium]
MARVRWGTATAVDARGTRWPVPAVHEDGCLRMTVEESILRAAQYPLALDPLVGAEFGMDTPVPAPGVGAEWQPAVASDGANYLVVWTFQRDATTTNDIYAARIGSTGALLDPFGIAIATATNAQANPAVAFANGTFLVVWENGSGNQSDIHGARLSAGGVLLNTNPIVISAATGSQTKPAVAASGGTFLVVWEDTRNVGQDIFGARVSAGGEVLDGAGLALASHFSPQGEPAVG